MQFTAHQLVEQITDIWRVWVLKLVKLLLERRVDGNALCEGEVEVRVAPLVLTFSSSNLEEPEPCGLDRRQPLKNVSVAISFSANIKTRVIIISY